MDALSFASISDSSAVGQFVRCTESGPVGSVGTNRSCQTRSVMNGTIGDINRVNWCRVSCSVHSAAWSPSQKRRRLRRTYQLDRSSMKPCTKAPACWVSKSSRSAVTSTMSCWVAETSQRSSTCRSATGGASPVGVHPFTRAYSEWNATVFQ